ncbi:MAG TPA: hypothetical protein VD927_12385 [Chryseosolibacter sp.]|nr:hypothetical protein [Chryseosolibacter sp.]
MNRLFSILLLVVSLSCSEDDPGGVPCDADHTQRIGAICMDGSRSDATGSGACSHHGGVDYWLCK